MPKLMSRSPQAQSVSVTPPPTSQNSALERFNALKAREQILKEQLEETQDRREELAQQSQSKSGADRAGLDSRIGLLDQRLSQIETDITNVGKELAAAAPSSLIEPPEPRIIHQGFSDEDVWGAGFFGSFLTIALLGPFVWRALRRRTRAITSTGPAIATERIDRMEQAIDSIAVEIERVSENQRFMTRLMTETQLAGSIAAVRGATEAAKVAAEGSSHG
jgi:hypothetical protein